MKLLGHTVLSLTVGGILYSYIGSFTGFLWFLIAGILVDLDHYLDYVREKGVSFNYIKVYNICKRGNEHFKKLTLILHSYEFLILLWVGIKLFDLNIVWQYASIGLTLHLIIDQLTNPVRPLAYFFCYRLLNKFDSKKIFVDRRVNYVDSER